MSLDEYKRKRRFEETPEPPPKVEKQSGHRFVVQRPSRHAPALRLSPGNGGRAEVVGGAERAVARSRGQAAGHAGRGSSRFVFRLRRHDSRRQLRRWLGDGLGRWNLGAALAGSGEWRIRSWNRQRSCGDAGQRRSQIPLEREASDGRFRSGSHQGSPRRQQRERMAFDQEEG